MNNLETIIKNLYAPTYDWERILIDLINSFNVDCDNVTSDVFEEGEFTLYSIAAKVVYNYLIGELDSDQDLEFEYEDIDVNVFCNSVTESSMIVCIKVPTEEVAEAVNNILPVDLDNEVEFDISLW